MLERDIYILELIIPKICYCCKQKYVKVHFFYDQVNLELQCNADQLCPECAVLNYARRFQKTDLRGRIAIVTGARIKVRRRKSTSLRH